ncbi:mediator of RNA polymerase II transcription subunit 29-like isoform X2 [Artemia franciscana]|uniref:Mediator of RNA polymerase II transcription subunit 29 n=2 Tax=Artemia franciscana TaxID=6661 RepID=A0AA88KYM3_ARTSF|nr:hypothetical protein QYM36_014819 [Artemia franciscana]KAK2706920.1 hypothetical protein QYM36_014819 [Artemia franciscana]
MSGGHLLPNYMPNPGQQMQQQGVSSQVQMIQQVGLGSIQQGGMMVQPSQAQQSSQQSQQQSQADQQRIDPIQKAKALIWPLKENLSAAMKLAAQNLQQNNMIDLATGKASDNAPPRYDRQLEEFYAICDQLELNLKNAIECAQQTSSSHRYANVPIVGSRPETPTALEPINYSQFLNLTRLQVEFCKELHDSLIETSVSIAPMSQQES